MDKRSISLFFLSFLILLGSCEEETLVDNTFGKLTGKVVSKGLNLPLENVKISTTPVSTTVFTDSEGNFEIPEIIVGEYSVQAELEDYITAFEAANIVQGRTVNVVFEMDSVETGNIAPLSPRLLSPEDGAQGLIRDVEFIWSSSASDDDEINYTLELRNGSNNTLQRFEELQDTTLLVQNLSVGVNYFWQVIADDGINEPVNSSISSFTTRGTTSNRFFYVREIDGNNVIFSGADPSGGSSNEVNQNEFQLTDSNKNSFRPHKNQVFLHRV